MMIWVATYKKYIIWTSLNCATDVYSVVDIREEDIKCSIGDSINPWDTLARIRNRHFHSNFAYKISENKRKMCQKKFLNMKRRLKYYTLSKACKTFKRNCGTEYLFYKKIHNDIDLFMNSMIFKQPNQLLGIKYLFFKIEYIYFKINILQSFKKNNKRLIGKQWVRVGGLSWW